MKIGRFRFGQNVFFGQISGNDTVHRLTGTLYDGKFNRNEEQYHLSELSILPPVIPTKIFGLGYNYKDLVGWKETYDEPVIFFKPVSALVGPGDQISIPDPSLKTWVEVELAIVIGKECKHAKPGTGSEYIFGYTIGNDVTMKNVLSRDHHLARSKGPDTFCPIGPWIETDIDTSSLHLQTKINGQVFQDSYTRNRILNDDEIVCLLSSLFTLYPGDLILTGTPGNAENSIIVGHDLVKMEIEGIGILENPTSLKENN
jgi:2-keto-4-pentenoate hydratase/2-oxohepta-3-ene-1,7-dioic acid hydratase in catechol pathway